MKIKTISVSSMLKCPHPSVDFATLSSLVTLSAELISKDDAEQCVRELQAKADALCDRNMDEKAGRLKVRAASAKAQDATDRMAGKLVLKHEPF
jgi:hypothetical protein